MTTSACRLTAAPLRAVSSFGLISSDVQTRSWAFQEAPIHETQRLSSRSRLFNWEQADRLTGIAGKCKRSSSSKRINTLLKCPRLRIQRKTERKTLRWRLHARVLWKCPRTITQSLNRILLYLTLFSTAAADIRDAHNPHARSGVIVSRQKVLAALCVEARHAGSSVSVEWRSALPSGYNRLAVAAARGRRAAIYTIRCFCLARAKWSSQKSSIMVRRGRQTHRLFSEDTGETGGASVGFSILWMCHKQGSYGHGKPGEVMEF